MSSLLREPVLLSKATMSGTVHNHNDDNNNNDDDDGKGIQTGKRAAYLKAKQMGSGPSQTWASQVDGECFFPEQHVMYG